MTRRVKTRAQPDSVDALLADLAALDIRLKVQDGKLGYDAPPNTFTKALKARVLALRPELEADFARGDFAWLLAWLRENVHTQGRRFSALELVWRVTGEELSPKHLVRYLRERYGALYLH